jgi:hypothetical protein
MDNLIDGIFNAVLKLALGVVYITLVVLFIAILGTWWWLFASSTGPLQTVLADTFANNPGMGPFERFALSFVMAWLFLAIAITGTIAGVAKSVTDIFKG